MAADLVDPLYRRLRWQVLAGILVGYAGYYLVRKNFSLAAPSLIEQGFSRGELGFAMSGVAISYGLSKFLMGAVSDRSNSRLFLPVGLLVSAGIMFVMGLVPWATATIPTMFALLLFNGWAQGMGWPLSGRTMVHWWSQWERGTVVSVWNIAHNIGGGLIGPLFILGITWLVDWRFAFYVPAAAAVICEALAFLTMRDTPQSCGLPSVETWQGDFPSAYDASHDQELMALQIFVQYVLPKRMLWVIARANVFVYFLRYGVLDWAPTYLKEVKGFTVDTSSWAYFLYEWAGIPGTLLCSSLSGRLFRKNRGTTAVVFMVLVTVAVVVCWFNPPGRPSVDMAALVAIWIFYLRAGDADRPACAGTGAQEGRRHRRGFHGPVRSPPWLSCRNRGAWGDRGPLRLGRWLRDALCRLRRGGRAVGREHPRPSARSCLILHG